MKWKAGRGEEMGRGEADFEALKVRTRGSNFFCRLLKGFKLQVAWSYLSLMRVTIVRAEKNKTDGRQIS